jgi:hypothetical protein
MNRDVQVKRSREKVALQRQKKMLLNRRRA